MTSCHPKCQRQMVVVVYRRVEGLQAFVVVEEMFGMFDFSSRCSVDGWRRVFLRVCFPCSAF